MTPSILLYMLIVLLTHGSLSLIYGEKMTFNDIMGVEYDQEVDLKHFVMLVQSLSFSLFLTFCIITVAQDHCHTT